MIFSDIWQVLTSRLIGPIMGGTALVLALMLVVQTVNLSGARKEVSGLVKERNAALTDLGTCRTSRVSLEAAIADRDTKLKAQSDEATVKLASQQGRLDAALKSGKAAQSRIDALSKPMVGADQCTRLLELAERIK